MRTLINNDAIEEVATCIIRLFYADRPLSCCVDIEGLAQSLGMTIGYAHFADQRAEGFTSDGIVSLSVIEDGKQTQKRYEAGTIVLDWKLLTPRNSAHRRFVLAHEVAHYILSAMSPTVGGPLRSNCWEVDSNCGYESLKKHQEVCEAQADRMASVLLMPQFLIQQQVNDYHSGQRFVIYGKSDSVVGQDKICLQTIADHLGVSFTALLIRLKSLGLTCQRSIADYVRSIDLSPSPGGGGRKLSGRMCRR